LCRSNQSSDHHQIGSLREGEYVLCFGRSPGLRHFLHGDGNAPYPGYLQAPDPQELGRHSARFTRPLEALPQNVRVLEDDGSEAAQLRILGGAKLVVLPIQRLTHCPSESAPV
jgi:hypothetical protein